jgi:hypothetical protein
MTEASTPRCRAHARCCRSSLLQSRAADSNHAPTKFDVAIGSITCCKQHTKMFRSCKHYTTSKVAAKGSKTTSKSRQNSNITQYMGILAHQHLKNFLAATLKGGVCGDVADPTCPADDVGSTGPVLYDAVVVVPPWKPLDEPGRAVMDIITGFEDFLPTTRLTMAPGRAEKGSIRWGALDPLEDMCHTHSRIEGLGAQPSPPARATTGEEESSCAPWLFSETPNVARLLLATYHRQTRNIDPNISRWMLHRRRFATWENLFRNIAKVVRNIPCALHPVRRLIGPLIRIVRPSTRPMLAPGSDVRAIAAPIFFSDT